MQIDSTKMIIFVLSNLLDVHKLVSISINVARVFHQRLSIFGFDPIDLIRRLASFNKIDPYFAQSRPNHQIPHRRLLLDRL